jgi:hypothetical protein
MNRRSQWLLNVLGWDGLLPAIVVAAPSLVALIFPGRQGALELTFVVVPIAAFLIRMVNGSSRYSRGEFCRWQALLFGVAIFFLVGLDAALIMFHLINGGVGVDAWLMLGGLYAVYLVMMAIALYPLRQEGEMSNFNQFQAS